MSATAGISNLLLSELQSLSTEARRKHPEIKEAAERVIVILRSIKATSSAQVATELAKSDEVVKPFALACKTGHHKLTTISVQCLQQLISHQALSPDSIRVTLGMLTSVLSQGMDIQVKILQMILPLVSAYDAVSGETLVEAIHICFVLQQSRDPIVNNTAAAILRQLVVAVFDRVVSEDKLMNSTQVDAEADLTRKCAKDAYYVLQDLCLLLTDSETVFIRADTIDKGLVLELIESILTNHAKVVARHAAMAQLLRERLSPYIVHFFAEKSTFPLAVRCIRVVWLFIRDLHAEFNTECEIFLSILTRLMDPSTSSSSHSQAAPGRRRPSFVLPGGVGAGNPSTMFPPFYRVLALELVKKTVEDPGLLQELYAQFDGQMGSGEDCHVILDIITAVGKVVSERPTIRSSNSDGIPSAQPENSATGADTQLRRHAVDADAGSDKDQISARSCRMRSEMHKLLDKQEPPAIPDTYLFFLALSSTLSLVDGMASVVLPAHTAPLTALIKGKEVTKSVLAVPDASDQQVQVISGFATRIWPILLTAYSFFLNVRFDNSLFNQVMESSQKMVLVFGALGVRDARDAVLSLLCRHCLPHAAISEHERLLQQSQIAKTQSLATVREDEANGTDGRPPATAPLVTSSLIGAQFSMHSRQIQCLRAVISCAQFLANTLGPAWYPIMVTLQQADELLYQSRGSLPTPAALGANSNSSHGQTPGRSAGGRQRSMSTASSQVPSSDDDLSRATEFQTVREEYVQLFSLVRAHGSDAFIWVIRSLCALGSDLSSVPARHEFSDISSQMRSALGIVNRRMSALMDRPTFAVEELRLLAVENVDLLMGSRALADTATDTDSVGSEGWSLIMHHLLDTTTYAHTPSPIRTQACEAVSDVVLAAMELVTRADGLTEDDDLASEGINSHFVAMVANGDAQLRILTPLSQMMAGIRSSTGAEDSQGFGQFVEVRKLTLDTLSKLLQASGHSIMRAWDVVFDIIQSVVAAESAGSTHGVGGTNAESRQPGYLVRFAFPCLQLICTDYLADLPANCMRRCIQSLVEYGQQTEDLNISLTAIGQAWSLSDFFQRASPKSDEVNLAELSELISSSLVTHSDDSRSAIAHIVDGWWREELVSLEDTHTRQLLWLLLLHSLSDLGRDVRHEVRHGALQTLFRTLDMHGGIFDIWTWDSIIWTVLAPVLDRVLAERARVFDLIRQGRVEMLLSELEAEQMASKSGVVIEDPSRLHKKQWDETAATAVLGAAKVWRDNLQRSIRHVGYVGQAWQVMWNLAIDFLAGRRSSEGMQLLPVADKTIEVDVPDNFIDSVAVEVSDSQLYQRTRESVAAAIECVAALVGIGDLEGGPEDQVITQHWRTVWRAWLTIGSQMTNLPIDRGSLLDINQTVDGNVVYTQEVLLSYLQMFSQIFDQLRSCRWFSEGDCTTLLRIARRILLFVDAPLYSPDVLEISTLQAQIMDTVCSLQMLAQCKADHGDNLVSPDTVLSLSLGELAVYAVMPYIIRPEQGGSGTLYRDSQVIGRARGLFSVQLQRLAAHSSAANEVKKPRSGKAKYTRRAIMPTLVSLAVAALIKLGEALCSDQILGESQTSNQALASSKRILADGVLADSLVAIGLHLVLPLGAERPPADLSDTAAMSAFEWAKQHQAEAVDWLIRVVSLGMSRLRGCTDGDARSALADTWVTIGIVLGSAVGVPDHILTRDQSVSLDEAATERSAVGLDTAGNGLALSAECQNQVLDAIMHASTGYISQYGGGSGGGDDSTIAQVQPAEVGEYWGLLVRILEWGALMAAEPVVLLCVEQDDNIGMLFSAATAPPSSSVSSMAQMQQANRQALTMECFQWLFRMSSNAAADTFLPLWASQRAAPTLVRRCQTVLEAFVRDKALLGKSPMPFARVALLNMVLDNMARLQCRASALATGSSKTATSPAAHLLLLCDNLIDLLSAPDPAVLGSIQRCLRRIAGEIKQ